MGWRRKGFSFLADIFLQKNFFFDDPTAKWNMFMSEAAQGEFMHQLVLLSDPSIQGDQGRKIASRKMAVSVSSVSAGAT